MKLRNTLSAVGVGLAITVASVAPMQPASAATTIGPICGGISWAKHPTATFGIVQNCLGFTGYIVTQSTLNPNYATAVCVARLGTITVDRSDAREGYFGPGATSRCSTPGQMLTDHGHVSRIPFNLVLWQSN
jgi:hypothetical protein